MAMPLKVKIFLRSMLIQAAWNFERMQNIGFVFALVPVLKNTWGASRAELSRALLRHTALFNTQPYMAGFILGVAWKLEEDFSAARSEGEEVFTRRIASVKQLAASALAAIGDALFWGALRPLSLGICVIVWWSCGFYCWLIPVSSGHCPPAHGILSVLAGPLAGLLVYNFFALSVRWKGISLGYRCSGSAVCGLDAVNWQKLIKTTRALCFAAAVVIAGLMFRTYFSAHAEPGLVPQILSKSLMPAAMFAAAWVIKKLGYNSVSAYSAILLLSAAYFSFFKTPA